MATDIRLEFLEAYRLCPKVVFGSRVQEDEEIIGTGQMPVGNFVPQIVTTSLTTLQYNILYLMMRFATYETMDIFKDATKSSLELTVEERI